MARPFRYVPLSVHFATGSTRGKLLSRYSHAGLLTWVCLIAAAKRSRIQGEFTYVSEEQGWEELGLGYPFTPDFTLDEFFRFTGQLKLTRKRRDGQRKHIEITRWEEWNDDYGKELDAERKSRKRQENNPDTARTDVGQGAEHKGTEYEGEAEGEKTLSALSEKERKRLDKWTREFAVQSLLTNEEITDYLTRHGADDVTVVRLLRVAEEARAA